jgi:hypothetical protein
VSLLYRDAHFKECAPWHRAELRPRLFQSLLWPEGAILVDPAASKEAVMHHALGKQKNGDGQPNQKQELSNLEPGRLFPYWGCLIRTLSHLSYLSAKSRDCRNSTIRAPGSTRQSVLFCSISTKLTGRLDEAIANIGNLKSSFSVLNRANNTALGPGSQDRTCRCGQWIPLDITVPWPFFGRL